MYEKLHRSKSLQGFLHVRNLSSSPDSRVRLLSAFDFNHLDVGRLNTCPWVGKLDVHYLRCFPMLNKLPLSLPIRRGMNIGETGIIYADLYSVNAFYQADIRCDKMWS